MYTFKQQARKMDSFIYIIFQIYCDKCLHYTYKIFFESNRHYHIWNPHSLSNEKFIELFHYEEHVT